MNSHQHLSDPIVEGKPLDQITSIEKNESRNVASLPGMSCSSTRRRQVLKTQLAAYPKRNNTAGMQHLLKLFAQTARCNKGGTDPFL
jgi:hypothetical protein